MPRKNKSSSSRDSEPRAGNLEDLAESKIRLILAAEALFARGSIDGVSLREIAIKAGQGNHYAVQYHFGSREGLIRAVFSYRMMQMEDKRRAMLAAAEAARKLKDVRTLIEVLYLPQLELLDADGNHSYADFLSQYLMRRRFPKFGDFGIASPPNLARTFELLGQSLKRLPTSVLQRRVIGISLVFLNILASHGAPKRKTGNDETFESALEDTLRQMVIALSAPMARRPRTAGLAARSR